MSPKKRLSQRGNSFTTCLLTAVLFFGGLAFYYINYYRLGGLDEPIEGLTYVDQVPKTQLNSFRKMAVAKVCDPTKIQLDQLAEMRKKTARGEKTYEGFHQECKERVNNLLEIVDQGRLKRIPKKFKERYGDGLMAVHYSYMSVLSLEAAVEAESKAERDKHYKESLQHSADAKKRMARSRRYFSSKEWAE